MNKYLLGSLVALLGWTGFGHTQPRLGAPVTSESTFDYPYAQIYHSTDCRFDGAPRYPLMENAARSMTTPMRSVTGQMIPLSSGVPTNTDVWRMIADGSYSPAEVMAAKIKIDEAQGKARRAAVQYLATIDCRNYPEAEAAMIAALRTDRVEMVRYEAALALGTCRSLTEKMLEALNLTALGLELDGNPAEWSDRVRGAARASLNRNLARGLCVPPVGNQATAGLEWMTTDPLSVQRMGYVTPLYLPIAQPPVSHHERDIAETVSTQANSPIGIRSFLKNLFNPSSQARQSSRTTDPCLRGLAPLGSEPSLAMPTGQSIQGALPTTPSYNYQQ